MASPVPPPAKPSRPSLPRRIVVVPTDPQAEPTEVLAQFEGADVVGSKIHRELGVLAKTRPGQTVALEWLGPLGWQRFVTTQAPVD